MGRGGVKEIWGSFGEAGELRMGTPELCLGSSGWALPNRPLALVSQEFGMDTPELGLWSGKGIQVQSRISTCEWERGIV